MTQYTVNDLMEMAAKVNGRAKQRTIGMVEAETMLQEIRSAGDNVNTIRVYSRDGFVPNSYKYRVVICYFEAYRNEDGSFNVIASQSDAKRSRGQGALVTVNGRAK